MKPQIPENKDVPNRIERVEISDSQHKTLLVRLARFNLKEIPEIHEFIYSTRLRSAL